MSITKSFAIIPAAGHSRRMGQPKLLMPWGDRQTVIEHVVGIWRQSRVDQVVVVVRADDEPLQAVCRRLPVELLIPPEAPADMKASVRYAISQIEQQYCLAASDVWLVAPADLPLLSADVINRLLDRYDAQPSSIIAPVQQGRRGHPVLFTWALARELWQLGDDEGISTLVRRRDVLEVEIAAATEAIDMNTPADYLRAQRKWQERRETGE